MAHAQGIVEFPNLRGWLSASYHNALGISPGVVSILATPQREAPGRGMIADYGDVVFRFDGRTVRLKECRLDSIASDFTERGEVWRIAIQDMRWKLAYGQISGRYNIRIEDLEEIKLSNPRQTLDDGTAKSLRELAQMCFEAAGFRSASLGELRDDVYPQVEWNYENPGQALANLIEPYGYSVAYQPTQNRLAVVRLGRGAAKLPSGGLLVASQSGRHRYKPEELIGVCEPTWYQIDVLLEAVGREVDGTIKPIDELSYRPPGGWEAESPGAVGIGFRNVIDPKTGRVDRFGDPQKAGRYQEAACNSVWRLYRIHNRPLGVDGKPLKVPGLENVTITSRSQLLPLSTTQNLVTLDKDTQREDYYEAMVYGAFDIGRTDGKPCTEVPTGKMFPSPVGRAGEYRRPFSINANEGMVEFPTPVFRRVDGKMKPALLALRVGCTVRRDQTALPEAKEYAHKVTSLINLRGLKRYIPIQGAKLIVKPTYSMAGDISEADGFQDNADELKKYVEQILQEQAKQFNTDLGETRQYASLLFLDTDGMMQAVQWECTQAGATTSLSWGMEPADYVMPYEERRFYEKLSAQRVRALTALAQHFGVNLREPFAGIGAMRSKGGL